MSEFELMVSQEIERRVALLWLAQNIGVSGWPAYVEGHRTGRLFAGWRFVDTLPSREIVFTNMIDKSITIDDLAQYVNEFGISEKMQ